MPIQFRCQNCHQLLGISRSKAGSVVDCPACGRSLRVPGVDGADALPESVQNSSADTNLLNALEELSNLPASIGAAATIPPVPTGSGRERRPFQSGLTGAGPQSSQKDTMRIVPLAPASSTSRAETSRDIVREPAESPSEDEAAPLIIRELCDTDLIDERRIPAAPSRTRLPVVLIGATAIVAFFFGYLAALTQGTAPDEIRGETNPPLTANANPAVIDSKSEAVSKITGTITFSGTGKGESPDAGALVLLLPSANTSGLRLDARPLRNLQQSPAKEAVEVALNILGATITRAADNGTFSLDRRHGGPVTLIVISRHASRSESESIPPATAGLLAEWFESPAHLTGRLSVQEKPLPASGAGESDSPIEITF
jgi:hypothetical protein